MLSVVVPQSWIILPFWTIKFMYIYLDCKKKWFVKNSLQFLLFFFRDKCRERKTYLKFYYRYAFESSLHLTFTCILLMESTFIFLSNDVTDFLTFQKLLFTRYIRNPSGYLAAVKGTNNPQESSNKFPNPQLQKIYTH